MGYGEILFWIERMGFLITSITWSLHSFLIDSELLSFDTFMEYWVVPLTLFWVCILYVWLFAAEPESAEAVCTNPGVVLERFAILIIGMSSKSHELCFLVIFPVLNIYFAWCGGYPRGFQGSSSSTRIAEEQEFPSMDLCTRVECVMFWTERLGFVILSISWFFRDTIVVLIGWDLFYDEHLQFWLSTNLMYLLVSLERRFPRNHGGHWPANNVTSRHGFWLERVALLGCSYGFTLFIRSSNTALGVAMLHLCFSVVFPSLNVYFTWRGYSKEFLSNAVAAVEESVKCDVATVEDVLSKALRAQEESMHMKIENAMEENRQKYLAESEIHWQMVFKCILDSKNNSSATSAMEDVTGIVLNQIEDVKVKVLNEMEDVKVKVLNEMEDVKGMVLKQMDEYLKKFLVKSEDSWEPFQKDFIDSNDKCCTNVVEEMVTDQEERSLQHLLKEFVDNKDDSLVLSKIEDVVGKLLRIQEKRMHMKLVTALIQNRHECVGNCKDAENYKEKSQQLAWKLQLYRDLLHDPHVSIPCVSS